MRTYIITGAVFVVAFATILILTQEPTPYKGPPSSGLQSEPERIEDSPGFRAGYMATNGHPPEAQRFTKAEFDNHVFGRTKAEIRAEFGPPAYVQDYNDSWVYNDLAVFDAAAGTRAISVTVQFTGAPAPDDVVAQVTF